MTVGQLLDDIRERYLTQFRRTLSKLQSSGMEAWAERACYSKDGALVREGELNLPLRLDLVAAANGKAKEPFRVDSDALLSFEPIDFEWGGLPTRLAPFHWDGCHIRVTGVPKTADWSALRTWFDRWFDSKDMQEPDEHGLFGVVHFLSDPTRNGAATTFEVDFGSAPVEGFEEFLDALRDAGAGKIEIGYDHDG
jgi:hypothetical protein